jgi:hypothetical protein
MLTICWVEPDVRLPVPLQTVFKATLMSQGYFRGILVSVVFASMYTLK